MATLIAYLRSFRNGRGEQEQSASDQREAVTAWARRRRHHVAAFVEEDQVRSSDLGQRPALAAAIAALGDDGIDGLVVSALSDLSDDLVVQEQLLAEIRRVGAKVYSVEPDDAEHLRTVSSDSSRNLVRHVLRTTAENEPAILAIRSSVSASAGGAPPYGYRFEDGQLTAVPAEQAVLARIAELRSAGATFREIARTLEAEGHRAKRAKRWYPETVRRIVQRMQAPPAAG
jgi:DNA invertase Pin-like site-specific DNA recombinase